MIELVRHIEILLLENDCVVVPGFGGFITHYMPASWDTEENTFSPPVRTIGFNSQLKMNDGVLVQSYMEVYNTNFSDATKILEQAVNELTGALHRDGKVELMNIGEISLSVHGTYVFSPYDDKIISPFLYGLDSFEMKELKALRPEKVLPARVPVATNKKMYEIKVNRTVVRNAVAAVAAVVLFFYMSTPIQNTYVEKENYAQLLPVDLFGKIEQQSLLTTLIGTRAVADNTISQPKEPDTTIREQVAQPAGKRYHIIIASVTSKDDAQVMVADLKAKGYSDACVLDEEKRIRISIGSYSVKEEAGRNMVELHKNSPYKNAWLFIR